MSDRQSLGRASDLLRFQWSVQALAQDAGVQFCLFPWFVCVPDELALEFDECLQGFADSGLAAVFSPGQVDAIRELDRHLAAISGAENKQFWTDEALEGAPEWSEIRATARLLLERMNWPQVAPPAERALYVGPDA
ncbi:hypothetical protein KRR26_24155 [Corallococcus sp. M34]|uniref:hypothetical protein n=1 Tax=Citreicoccus inhibens TaxID=2849499 RepID=UPI001C245EA7|nr:hypothetical protein [Citreicoccus inhibens]MBU8898708.1 hypothetical protein [Citreicoccus inhibens]